MSVRETAAALNEMFALSKAARVKGYALAVKGGLFQFQTVTYDSKAKSNIKPLTGWISLEDAQKWIAQ